MNTMNAPVELCERIKERFLHFLNDFILQDRGEPELSQMSVASGALGVKRGPKAPHAGCWGLHLLVAPMHRCRSDAAKTSMATARYDNVLSIREQRHTSLRGPVGGAEGAGPDHPQCGFRASQPVRSGQRAGSQGRGMKVICCPAEDGDHPSTACCLCMRRCPTPQAHRFWLMVHPARRPAGPRSCRLIHPLAHMLSTIVPQHTKAMLSRTAPFPTQSPSLAS